MSIIRDIDILERYKKPFEIICEFTENTFNQFVNALIEITKVNPVLSLEALSARIAEQLNNDVKREEILDIIITLTNLYSLLPYTPNKTDLIENISQSLEDEKDNRSEIIKNKFAIFKDRLKKLLDINSLAVIIKAITILRESTNLFSNARVLTDVRPIFDVEVTNKPVLFAIMSTLKLSYVVDGQLKEFFVSMDESDINFLIEVFEQTRKEIDGLKVAFKDARLPCVDVE